MGARCPGCGQEVSPAALACPICLRPRSRQEIFAAYRESPAGRRFPWWRWRRPVLGLLLGAALFGLAREAGVWRHWRQEWDRRGASQAPVAASPTSPAAVPAGRAAAANPTSPAEALRQAPKEGGWRRLLQWGRSVASVLPASPPPPPVPKPGNWTVYGNLYDIEDLSPVTGAHISLRHRVSDQEYSAETDRWGRYAVEVPKARDWGYDVGVRHPHFAEGFLEDMSPSYLEQGASERREAGLMLRTTVIVHLPFLPPESRDMVDNDLFLARRAVPAARPAPVPGRRRK